VGLLLAVLPCAAQELSPQDSLIIETILRLESYDYAKAKPHVRAAVNRYLDAKWGTDQALDLIDRLKIRDRSDQLLVLALDKPMASIGLRAAKMVLGSDGIKPFDKVVRGADGKRREAALSVLGGTGRPEAINLLAVVATATARPASVRSAAIRALARSRGGQTKILDLARAGKLSEDLHVTAATALATSPDPAIRRGAAKHLKTPAGAGGKPLPPIADLVAQRGNPARGRTVYQRACFVCHKVGNEGLDFGPALTEIGDKLPREALYQAILEPSAGISFGYEGFVFKLKNTAELMGFIASETDDQVTLRMQGGVSHVIDKAEIDARRKLSTSLMPPGLQQAMSQQELVDLVEYLSALKKKPGS